MSEARPGEEAAWAEVAARWDDEEAHREYLSRLCDLEALSEAGRRYKAALDVRPDDPVARRWRDEVVRRATAVARALAERRYLVAEAGTGTGKTLAYLVPAALSGRKVVVSTATKALQEQIWTKDLPLLAERAGLDIS